MTQLNMNLTSIYISTKRKIHEREEMFSSLFYLYKFSSSIERGRERERERKGEDKSHNFHIRHQTVLCACVPVSFKRTSSSPTPPTQFNFQ